MTADSVGSANIVLAAIIMAGLIAIAIVIVLGFLLHSSNDYEERRAFTDLAEKVERLRKRVDDWTMKK